jgi:hypothetical protein
VESREYRTRLRNMGLLHAVHVVTLVDRRVRLDLARSLLNQLRLAAHRLLSASTADSLSTVLLTVCDDDHHDDQVDDLLYM